LLAFSTGAEAAAHCTGIEVEDSRWLFFAEDGSPLEARFQRPNRRTGPFIVSGSYVLVRALSGLWLQERLAQVTSVKGCGLSAVPELVELLKINRSNRAARNE
jgi:hypothetical protein